MLLAIAAVIVGLVILVWSADKFVEGAAAVAKHLGMPILLIGVIIVGFGTSAPELAVSANAALNGSPGMALGNAFGSNIANLTLILGAAAVLSPLLVASGVIRREIPLLLAATAVATGLLYDGEVSRIDAVIMLVVFAATMGWSIYAGIRDAGTGDVVEAEYSDEIPDMTLGKAWFWLASGLVLLVGSSHVLVWGAEFIALSFGVSELVIGLTILAVGTSLPELAASIAAVRKGEHDMIIGNVIGSNLFNTLAVVGLAAVITPIGATEPEFVSRDLPVNVGITLAVLVMAVGLKGKGRINRFEGGLLLVTFAGYMTWVGLTSM
ncbi:calcium/sodium antiporter [Salinibius halmophilus]|uniref:calcium/sodium antiporter n=1 Tax=Salinibius halmophilus TaxID=1853216 RepID=UPI000E663292|nr:calcium/sodium antiporter [Salinibius halmophilus]